MRSYFAGRLQISIVEPPRGTCFKDAPLIERDRKEWWQKPQRESNHGSLNLKSYLNHPCDPLLLLMIQSFQYWFSCKHSHRESVSTDSLLAVLKVNQEDLSISLKDDYVFFPDQRNCQRVSMLVGLPVTVILGCMRKDHLGNAPLRDFDLFNCCSERFIVTFGCNSFRPDKKGSWSAAWTSRSVGWWPCRRLAPSCWRSPRSSLELFVQRLCYFSRKPLASGCLHEFFYPADLLE